MGLKINRSVKRSKNAVTDRPSMGVASSGLWAPSGATSLSFFSDFFFPRREKIRT